MRAGGAGGWDCFVIRPGCDSLDGRLDAAPASAGPSEEMAEVIVSALSDGTDRFHPVATERVQAWVATHRETSEEASVAVMRWEAGLGCDARAGGGATAVAGGPAVPRSGAAARSLRSAERRHASARARPPWQRPRHPLTRAGSRCVSRRALAALLRLAGVRGVAMARRVPPVGGAPPGRRVGGRDLRRRRTSRTADGMAACPHRGQAAADWRHGASRPRDGSAAAGLEDRACLRGGAGA